MRPSRVSAMIGHEGLERALSHPRIEYYTTKRSNFWAPPSADHSKRKNTNSYRCKKNQNITLWSLGATASMEAANARPVALPRLSPMPKDLRLSPRCLLNGSMTSVSSLTSSLTSARSPFGLSRQPSVSSTVQQYHNNVSTVVWK